MSPGKSFCKPSCQYTFNDGARVTIFALLYNTHFISIRVYCVTIVFVILTATVLTVRLIPFPVCSLLPAYKSKYELSPAASTTKPSFCHHRLYPYETIRPIKLFFFYKLMVSYHRNRKTINNMFDHIKTYSATLIKPFLCFFPSESCLSTLKVN